MAWSHLDLVFAVTLLAGLLIVGFTAEGVKVLFLGWALRLLKSAGVHPEALGRSHFSLDVLGWAVAFSAYLAVYYLFFRVAVAVFQLDPEAVSRLMGLVWMPVVAGAFFGSLSASLRDLLKCCKPEGGVTEGKSEQAEGTTPAVP